MVCGVREETFEDGQSCDRFRTLVTALFTGRITFQSHDQQRQSPEE